MAENIKTEARWRNHKRKQNANAGVVDSEETPLSTTAATVKPTKKKGNISTDQSETTFTQETYPSEKVSENERMSKDVAGKKKAKQSCYQGPDLSYRSSAFNKAEHTKNKKM